MTLTYISCSSDFYTFFVDVPLSLGCIIRKGSAEGIAIRGNGTGLEYMCTRHFVYIFFNPVFQLSTAKNETNLFNNHVLIVAPVTFAPAGAMTPSAEFLCLSRKSVKHQRGKKTLLRTSRERRPCFTPVGKNHIVHQQEKKNLLNLSLVWPFKETEHVGVATCI